MPLKQGILKLQRERMFGLVLPFGLTYIYYLTHMRCEE